MRAEGSRPISATFVAGCLATIVLGLCIAVVGFPKAFPEASIDFRIGREEAVSIARKGLVDRGFDLTGYRPLVIFEHDVDTKLFLERTLGLARASELLGTRVPVWRFSIRFVRELQKLEYRASVSPGGELLAYRRLLPEKDPAPDLGEGAARRLAEETLGSMRGAHAPIVRPGGPGDGASGAVAADTEFIGVTEDQRPARMDRTYVWASRSTRVGEGRLKYLVEVQGDRVGRSTVFFEVPEAWREEYRAIRSRNEAASAVASFGLILTGLAAIAMLAVNVRRRDVRWRLALLFGATGTVLSFLSSLNELPLALWSYETTDGFGSFLAQQLVMGAGSAAGLGILLFVLVAAGEPLYRQRCGALPSLGLLLSWKGLGSRTFVRGLLLGYALAGAFVAYQVLFYLLADRLGAWAPAEVPYSNLLGTRFPWLSVLLMGFAPAASEELSSRLFSIPFLMRFSPRWVAVVVPALIWGFAHSAYPNQPFWIRGLEVSLAGVAVGWVMLRQGLLPLLVWHFTVDAVYTALVLVRSSNPWVALSGAASALVLLLPLLAALYLRRRRGAFTPDSELTNVVDGTAPEVPLVEPGAAPVRFRPGPPAPRDLVLRLVAVAAAGLFAVRLSQPRTPLVEGPPFRLDRAAARSAADDLLRRAGDDPARYVPLVRPAEALPALEGPQDDGSALLPYDWSPAAEEWLLSHGGRPSLARSLEAPGMGPVWSVRYVRPEDRHSWRVAVDARSGRVVGYERSLPREEPGASLTDAEALERARQALSGTGEDVSALALVSSRSEKLPARRDHHLVFERSGTSPPGETARASRRAVVKLSGDLPSLVAFALKLPEEFLRGRERSTAVTYVGLALRVIGLGTLLGLFLFELLRSARRGRIPWARLTTPAALAACAGLVVFLNRMPLLMETYSPPLPLAVFQVFALIGLALLLVLWAGGAILLAAPVLAARPDAPAAFRPGAPGARRAAASALFGAFALISLQAVASSVKAAFPEAAGASGLGTPVGIAFLFPVLSILESGLKLALLLGCAASLLALLSEDLLASKAARAVTACLAAVGAAPEDARTLPQLLVPMLSGLIVASAVIAVIVCVLRDDPRAYLGAGLLLAAMREAPALLLSPVPAWRVNGAVAMLVALAPLVYWSLAKERESTA